MSLKEKAQLEAKKLERFVNAKLLRKIELLDILVKGCRVHPVYRAIRPATGRCLPCVEMWEARQELNDFEKKSGA